MDELTSQQIWSSWQDGLCREDASLVISSGGNEWIPRIQQDEREMVSFLDALKSLIPAEQRKVALEIGLFEGGTHLIWKMLFKHVISVEINPSSCLIVAKTLKDKTNSTIICASSQLPGTVKTVQKVLAKLGEAIDFLLIDGDHSKSAVESDYLNYEPLVRIGGVIAFHDSREIAPVRDFVADLEYGRYCHKEEAVKMQHFLYHHGISYYVKDR